MPHIEDVMLHCIAQRGDRYIFGAEARASDANPDRFDCSELVEWACARAAVSPPVPDGSWIQWRHCRNHNTLTSVAQAIATRGALLFFFSSDPGTGGRPRSAHVALSLGDGTTIEARGSKWGVGTWAAAGRFSHAGLIPGVDYGGPKRPLTPVPPAPPPPKFPLFPGRYITQPPMMRGDDVRLWQQRMRDRGWRIDVDGIYGPNSEAVARKFQAEKGLDVDGIVGPKTWDAAWTAPVT